MAVTKIPTATLYQQEGQVLGEVALDPILFGETLNNHLLYEAVKMYLNNQRQGTVAKKNRAQVRGSTRKVWRQKGLGRARVGTIRSPIRVGGGRTFRVDPKDYVYNIPKKVRRKALRMAFSDKAQKGAVYLIEKLHFEQPKTRQMAQLLGTLNLAGKKGLLLMDHYDENVYKSARNIPTLEVDLVHQTSVYAVLNATYLLLTKAAVEQLGEMRKG